MNILQAKKMLSLDESRMIEQTMFTYSPLGKALEKQTNKQKIEEQRRKQIDANINQNKRQVGLINNDDKNLSHLTKNLCQTNIWRIC